MIPYAQWFEQQVDAAAAEPMPCGGQGCTERVAPEDAEWVPGGTQEGEEVPLCLRCGDAFYTTEEDPE